MQSTVIAIAWAQQKYYLVEFQRVNEEHLDTLKDDENMHEND